MKGKEGGEGEGGGGQRYWRQKQVYLSEAGMKLLQSLLIIDVSFSSQRNTGPAQEAQMCWLMIINQRKINSASALCSGVSGAYALLVRSRGSLGDCFPCIE